MDKRKGLGKGIYLFTGIISLVLAYIGIIVPGFPAIPFIILAAYFFTNSSPRIYAWMLRQRLLKKLLTKSQKIDRRILKALLISQVWFSVTVAEIVLARSTISRILFIAGGLVLTVLILILVKSRHADNPK